MKNVFIVIKDAAVEVSRVQFRNLFDGRGSQVPYAVVPIWFTMLCLWLAGKVQPQYNTMVSKVLFYMVIAAVLQHAVSILYTAVRQLYVEYTLCAFKKLEQQRRM